MNLIGSIPWPVELRGGSMIIEVSRHCGMVAGGTFLLLYEWDTTLIQLGKVYRSKTWSRSDITALNL